MSAYSQDNPPDPSTNPKGLKRAVPIPLSGPPWERQDGETEAQWEAFVEFRDDGPSRSVMRTAESRGIPLPTLRRWTRRCRWNERVLAWENHLDGVRQNAHVESVEEMAHRHASLARKGVQKAEEALRHLKADEMTAAEAARLMDVSVKVERLSRGQSTQNLIVKVEAMFLEVIEAAVGDLPDQYRMLVVDRIQRELAERANPPDDAIDVSPVSR